MGRVVSDSALTSCINAARVAIGDSGQSQRLIRTLRGRGVRFVGDAREETNPSKPIPPSAVQASPRPALALPDKPSVAILPFTNMSGDPQQEYFADGITDEIITQLSNFSELFVIARNSSFQYKNRPMDVREIGRELGVRYLLQGGIRRSSDRFASVPISSTPHRAHTAGPGAMTGNSRTSSCFRTKLSAPSCRFWRLM